MFAVLHLADFALHAVLRTTPHDTTSPVALFSAHRKKSVVLAATASAQAMGVTVGMSAPQAVARCPPLVILAPSSVAEAEARASLLAVAASLAPTLEDTAPGVCTVDLRGNDLTQTLPAARRAVTTLADHGLPACAGLARTPLLALYAARAGASVLHLPLAEEAAFLAPLPLAVADPTPALAEVLAQWGLHTLGDLLALPRDELIRRFGVAGLSLWQRASGGEPRPLRPVIAPLTFTAALEFEDPVETLEPLLFLLRRFLDRLCLELTSAQFVAAELTLSLRLADETTHTRRFRLPEPNADPAILFRALHTHLESLQTASAITALSLDATPARPLVRQPGLFDTGLRDPHGFAETLARISALVGPDQLGTPLPEDNHRPDTFALTSPPPTVPPCQAPPLHAFLGLPLRRFRPPLRVGVTDSPEGKTFLWAEHHRGEISFRSAPYYRDGEWWQNDRAWSRIEWDVALTEGGLYRLILVGEDYFLEGQYD